MNERLLMVSPTPFLPPDAGNRIRIGNLLDVLRREGFDVYFLHVEREHGDASAMASWLGEGHFLSMPYARPVRRESTVRKFGRRIRQVFDRDLRHQWGLDDWYDPAITDTVLEWHERREFGAVIVEYVFFSRLLEALPEAVTGIIDTHDRFALRHRIYLAQGMTPRFFSTSVADEARGLSRADLVLAIQDSERKIFSEMTARPVVTVGHLVRIEFCQRLRQEGRLDLLVVGSENEINIDGLNAFVAHDWPAIRAAYPYACLRVAGGLGKHLPSAPGVSALGFVSDIADAYRQADIVVNPVRNGTGLNIKSIEALGFGMPLISTSAGSRGLDGEAGCTYLRADGPSATVEAVRAFADDPLTADRLGREAMEFAKKWNRKAVNALKEGLSG